MLKTGKLNIIVKQGDTLPLQMTFPFDLTGVRIRQQVRATPASSVLLEYDSDNDDIVIDEQVATWDAAPVSLAAKRYRHDVELIFTDGKVLTYLEGSFVVTTQITKDD